MKLGAKSAPAPAEQPTDTTPTDQSTDTGDDLDFSTNSGDQSQTDDSTDTGADAAGDDSSSSSDKPFDDEPFDAGVEANEEEDPKKFIEQLTGKLGQSLRKYEDDKGEPDFELEKFAINSLLSATHTGEMDPEDQKDIIKKVKKSGKGDDNVESSDETGDETGGTEDTGTEDTGDENTGAEDTNSEKAPADDSGNMFETEMLDEMGLDDHMAKDIIKLYDKSDGETREIIFRKITLTKPFPEKDQKDKDINREKFLTDLQDDVDKEHIEEIMRELEEMGIYKAVEMEMNETFENSFILQNPPKNNMFQEGSNDILDEYEIYEVVEEGKKKKKKRKKDACYHKVRARYDVWPSAYASGALVKCRKVGAANWGNSTDESVEGTEDLEALKEKWSAKYKKSIDCNNPKGFSQRAHCQGKKKHG